MRDLIRRFRQKVCRHPQTRCVVHQIPFTDLAEHYHECVKCDDIISAGLIRVDQLRAAMVPGLSVPDQQQIWIN